MGKVLEARALCAFYGATQVLFGLDIDLDEGGITTLLGANGAGKTTTLRSLSGMCRTHGEILFDLYTDGAFECFNIHGTLLALDSLEK